MKNYEATEQAYKNGYQRAKAIGWITIPVMITNIVIISTFAVCVTIAAIHFDKPAILWWYLLMPCLAFTWKKEK